MPFSVFHSWLERLLVFFFLAWLACLGSRNSSRHPSSVRQRGSRKTLTTPWIDPPLHCSSLHGLHSLPQPLWHGSLSSSLVFPPITISPHLLRVWLTAAKKELLPSWTSEAANALFRHQPLSEAASRGCGGCWQQLEAMEGESSQHHAILLLAI